MSEWNKVKIGAFLKQYRNTIYVDDAQQYRQVTISSKDGVKYRCTKIGKEIGRKRQFLIDLKKYPNTVIFTRQGLHEGSIGLAPEEVDGCIATENMPMFSVDDTVIDTQYLKNLLRSPIFANLVSTLTPTGSAQKSIHERDLLPLEISIPDLGTQKKIVKEISSQLEKTELLSSEIEKQKSYAKQLRQNILQEAIEGKLTADWRKQHPVKKGNPDYDAEALLNYLQQKKESLKNDPLVKREKIRTPVSDTEKEFSIPNNWIWIRMGELCYSITKGTTPDVHEIKADGEIPYLKMFNIVNQKIDFDYRPQYISKKVHDEKLTRSKVYPNDVIMNIVGPPMGKIAIVTDEFPEWNLNQAMAIFRGYDISINPYIYVFLNSMIWFKYVHTLGVVGQENMSLEQCKDIAISLPPLAEQKEIVARVEQHIQTITQLETQIATRETTTKQLMQSILKDAFEEVS